MSFVAKVKDPSSTTFLEDGLEVGHEAGYPSEKLIISTGDYVAFEINNKTGKILGWKPVSFKDL